MSEPLDITFYLVGYIKAANRFTGCGDRLFDVNRRTVAWFEDPVANPNPDDDDISLTGIFIPLFEALNWAVSLDDRLASEWPDPPGRDWHKKVSCGGRVRGLRYARNSVHHDWAQAIDLPQKYRHLPARRSIKSWRWTSALPLKSPGFQDPDGERAYREKLVGECVVVTFAELFAGFGEALHYLSEHKPGAIKRDGPFEIGPRAGDAAA